MIQFRGLEAGRRIESKPPAPAEAEPTPARAKELAQFDVRVTSELLELGRHVASGHLEPTTIDRRWNVKRGAIDYVAALQQAWELDVAGFLDAVRPSHPEYAALQNALASLHGQKTSGWPAVPRASLKLGNWNQAVVPLRKRLAVSEYLSANGATDSAQFDADVAAAVQKFQEHHALKATGHVDPPTLAALNVPLDERIEQVALNLERWRWMPDSLGARHFIVNIPYYPLIARENGQPVLDIRIVVGKGSEPSPEDLPPTPRTKSSGVMPTRTPAVIFSTGISESASADLAFGSVALRRRISDRTASVAPGCARWSAAQVLIRGSLGESRR